MDERVIQLRIGVMVLATAMIAVILIVMFGEWPTFQGKYTIFIEVDEAPGVARDTPVQKSGIRIGRVADVQLLDEGGVRLTLEIEGDRKVFADDVCQIRSQMFGDTVIEFVRGPDRAQTPKTTDPNAARESPLDRAAFQESLQNQGGTREVLPPGAKRRGVVVKDALDVVRDLQEDFSQTSRKLGQAAEKVDQLLTQNEARINLILSQTSDTLTSLETMANNANAFITDEHGVSNTVKEMSGLISQADRTFQEMNSTFGGMGNAIAKLDTSLENIKPFTQALGVLGEPGEDGLSQIERTAKKLEILLEDTAAIAQGLNGRGGTLGKLIHDPELYENLNQAARNIEMLSAQAATDLDELSRDLQPVIRDMRIFSDKVARHPELLGVRGALGGSSGTKGVPTLTELRGLSGISQRPRYPEPASPR